MAQGANSNGQSQPVYMTTSAGADQTGTNGQQVQGTSASGVADDGSNPVKAGGKYNLTPPTFADGQRGDLQITPGGSLRVNLTNQFGVKLDANLVATDANANPTALVPVASYGLYFNGTTWDRQRKPNAYVRVASSAASGNPAVAKATAGDVSLFWGQNAAAITYLQIYNKATAPVIGTDTPVLTYPIPASAAFTQQIPNGGAYFSTGIAYAFTTDPAGTTGAAAAAVIGFALLYA